MEFEEFNAVCASGSHSVGRDLMRDVEARHPVGRAYGDNSVSKISNDASNKHVSKRHNLPC